MPRPRPAKFRVLPLNPPQGEYKWRIDGYQGRRRVQEKFKTEKEALARAKRYDLENDQWKDISLNAEDHVFMKSLKSALENTGKIYTDILTYVKRFEKINRFDFQSLQPDLNRN